MSAYEQKHHSVLRCLGKNVIIIPHHGKNKRYMKTTFRFAFHERKAFHYHLELSKISLSILKSTQCGLFVFPFFNPLTVMYIYGILLTWTLLKLECEKWFTIFCLSYSEKCPSEQCNVSFQTESCKSALPNIIQCALLNRILKKCPSKHNAMCLSERYAICLSEYFNHKLISSCASPYPKVKHIGCRRGSIYSSVPNKCDAT